MLCDPDAGVGKMLMPHTYDSIMSHSYDLVIPHTYELVVLTSMT